MAVVRPALEGKIDFEGQALTDRLVTQLLCVTGGIAFIVGFVLQSLRITFGIVAAGTLVCCIVTVPPYSSYNSHPVKWLPPLSEFGEPAGATLESETSNLESVAESKKSL